MDKISDRTLRIINSFLLLGILLILLLIFKSMPQQPISIYSFEKAKGNESVRKELIKKIPIVSIYGKVDVIGEVDVTGEVDANVTNYELDVNVTNEPLQVEKW